MNKKVFGVFVSLLAVALLATPVMAAPATKIEGVTATFGVPEWTFGKMWVVGQGILQVRGNLISYTVTLNIPGQAPLEGTVSAVNFVSMVKFTQPPPDPEAEANDHTKAIWTFTGEGTTGTFEGVRHRKAIGFPTEITSYVETHSVLRGTGDFLGQTLELSSEGPPGSVSEGFLLIPK